MYRRYFWVLLIMVLCSPLGLLAGGTAWGEWAAEDLAALIGFVPQGLERAAGWWQGVFPDYGVRGLGESAGYLLSAFIGAAAVYAVMLVYLKLVARFK